MFLLFAAAAAAVGAVARRRTWRTAAVVALAVLLLAPVKVPTLAGTFFMPHGYVQTVDFDPRYYFREPAFTAAAAGTAA